MAATSNRSAMSQVAGATAGTYSQGMYSAENEHDACGVALVADLAGRQNHEIVRRGLTALLRLEHRGARGAEYNTGDGVGILIQVPDAFLRAVVDFDLPGQPGTDAANKIIETYGNGGKTTPLIATVTLPSGQSVQDQQAAVGKAFGMPTTLLVDPNGCELATLAGPAEWASDDAVKLVTAALGK